MITLYASNPNPPSEHTELTNAGMYISLLEILIYLSTNAVTDITNTETDINSAHTEHAQSIQPVMQANSPNAGATFLDHNSFISEIEG